MNGSKQDESESSDDIAALQILLQNTTDMRERSHIRSKIHHLRLKNDDLDCSQSLRRSLKRIRRSHKFEQEQKERETTYAASPLSNPLSTQNCANTVADSTITTVPNKNSSSVEQNVTDDSPFDESAEPRPFVRNSSIRRNRRSRRSTTSRSSDHSGRLLSDLEEHKPQSDVSDVSGGKPLKVRNNSLEESLWICDEAEKAHNESGYVSSDVTTFRRHRSDGEVLVPASADNDRNKLQAPVEDLDNSPSPVVSPYRSPSLFTRQHPTPEARNRNSLAANWTPPSRKTSVTSTQGATCQYKTISTTFRDPSWKSASGTPASDSSDFLGRSRPNQNNNNAKSFRPVEWRVPSSSKSATEPQHERDSELNLPADEHSKTPRHKHSAGVIFRALGKKLFSPKPKSPGGAGQHTSGDTSSTSSSGSGTKFPLPVSNVEDAADLPPVAPVRPTHPTSIRRSRAVTTNPRLKVGQRGTEPSPVRDRRKIFEQNGELSPVAAAFFGRDYSKPASAVSKPSKTMAEVIPRSQAASYQAPDNRSTTEESPVEENNNGNSDDIGESTLEELDFLLKQYKDHDKRVKIRDTIRLLKENLQEGDRKPTRSPGEAKSQDDSADVTPATVHKSEFTVKTDPLPVAKEEQRSAEFTVAFQKTPSATPLSRFSVRSTSLREPKPSYRPPADAINRASSFKLSRPKDFIIKKVDSSPQLTKVAESETVEDSLNNNIPKYRVPATSSQATTPQIAKGTVVTAAPSTAPNASSYNKTASPFPASPKATYRRTWEPPKTDPARSTTPLLSQTARPAGPIPLRRSGSSKENRTIPVIAGNVRRSKSILGRILGQRIDAERTPLKATSVTVGSAQLNTPSVLDLQLSSVTPTNKESVSSPVERPLAQVSEPLSEEPKSPIAQLSPCKEIPPVLAFKLSEPQNTSAKPTGSLSGSQSSVSSQDTTDSEDHGKGRVYDLQAEEFRSCSSTDDESPTLSQLVDAGKNSEDETEDFPHSHTTDTGRTESSSVDEPAEDLAPQKETADDEVEGRATVQAERTDSPLGNETETDKSDSEQYVSAEDEPESTKLPSAESIVGERIELAGRKKSPSPPPEQKETPKRRRKILPAIHSQYIACETETVQFFNVQVIPPTPTPAKSAPSPQHEKERDNHDNKERKKSSSSEQEEDVFSDSSLEEDADMDRYSSRALRTRTSVKDRILATEDINGNTKPAPQKQLRDRYGKPISTGDDIKTRIQKYKVQATAEKDVKTTPTAKRNGSIRVPGSTGKRLDVSKFEKEDVKVDRDSSKTTVTLTTTAPRATTRMTSREEKLEKTNGSTHSEDDAVKVDRDTNKTTITLTTTAPKAPTRMTPQEEASTLEPEEENASRSLRGSRSSTSSADSTKKERKASSGSQNDDSARSRRARRAKDAENGAAKLENASISATSELKDLHTKKYAGELDITSKSSRNRKARNQDAEPAADVPDSKLTNGNTNPPGETVEFMIEDSLSDWSARRRKRRGRGREDEAPEADQAQKSNTEAEEAAAAAQPIKTALHVRHSAPGEEILDSMGGYSIRLPRNRDKAQSRSSSEEEKEESRQSSVADDDSDASPTKQRSSRYSKNSVSSIPEDDVAEHVKIPDETAAPIDSGRLSGDDAKAAEAEDDIVADDPPRLSEDAGDEKRENEEEVEERVDEVSEVRLAEDVSQEIRVAVEIGEENAREDNSDVVEAESKQYESAEIEIEARESDKAPVAVYNDDTNLGDTQTTIRVSDDAEDQASKPADDIEVLDHKSEDTHIVNDAKQTTIVAETLAKEEVTQSEQTQEDAPRRHRRHKERKHSAELLDEADGEKHKKKHRRHKKHSEADKEGDNIEEKPRKKHHRKKESENAEEAELDGEKAKKRHHRKKHSEVDNEADSEKQKSRKLKEDADLEEAKPSEEESHKKKHRRKKETKAGEEASEERSKHKHRRHKELKEDEKESSEKAKEDGEKKEKKHKKHKDKESKEEAEPPKEEVKAAVEEKAQKVEEKVESQQKANSEETNKESEAPKTMHFSYDNLEEISDIALLEKMLAVAEEYEHRRRIRAVIRALKKGEKPNVVKDTAFERRTGGLAQRNASPAHGEIARKGALPQDSSRGLTSRTTARAVYERTEKSDHGSRSVSIRTERSSMTSGSKKIGSIFDREDDEIKTTSSSRATGSSRFADLEKRQAERKRELQRNRSMPASSSKDARKAFVAKLEAGAPKGGANKKVGRSPTFVVPNANNVKQLLLKWCQSKTRGYEHVDIMNFSSSWASGMAFCALVHHFFPEAFDYNELDPKNRAHNFDLAFTSAEKHADVTPLLEVEDMLIMGNRPDSKCVFTYVQFLYNHFRKFDQPLAPAKSGGAASKVVVKEGHTEKPLPESEDL